MWGGGIVRKGRKGDTNGLVKVDSLELEQRFEVALEGGSEMKERRAREGKSVMSLKHGVRNKIRDEM
jgi:hypothetical protein